MYTFNLKKCQPKMKQNNFLKQQTIKDKIVHSSYGVYVIKTKTAVSLSGCICSTPADIYPLISTTA